MSKTPKEIWCESGLYYDYKTDWSEGSWITYNDGGVKYIRADLIKERSSEAADWRSQSDEVQAAVAAALREAAGVARLVRDTGDKAHALGIEENAAAYASAGEVIEARILALITPDAQAALDRYVKERSDELVAAERGRIADLERRLKLWVPQNISETGRWPIPKEGE